MTIFAIEPSGVIWLGLILIAALAYSWGSVLTATTLKRASWPKELAHAELVYSERLFSVYQPVALVARVDRVYKIPTGHLVLVELKCRRADRPFLSDVIQLSVQRIALAGQTRQFVASYGYVLVNVPNRVGHRMAHLVELMSDDQVIALARRREGILAGDVVPSYPKSRHMCQACGFKTHCSGRPRGL